MNMTIGKRSYRLSLGDWQLDLSERGSEGAAMPSPTAVLEGEYRPIARRLTESPHGQVCRCAFCVEERWRQ